MKFGTENKMNLTRIAALYAAIGSPYGGISRGIPGQYKFGTYLKEYVMFQQMLKRETPISAEWGPNYRYSNTQPVLANEGTYERCQEWSFDPVKRQLKIVNWNGDLCYGEPKEVRATWIYEINDNQKQIVELIGKKLIIMVANKAVCDEEEEEQHKYRARVQVRIDQYLRKGWEDE